MENKYQPAFPVFLQNGLTHDSHTDTKPISDTGWIDNFKCRCSAITKMMADSRSNPQLTEGQAKWIEEYEARGKDPTEKQKLEYARLLQLRENSKKVILSDGCIEYLMEVYAWETQQMINVGKEALDAMQLKKGKEGESAGVILLSRVDRVEYKIHKERIFNDYLSGEIDVYAGKSVYEADVVPDIKNAFDYPTFLKKLNNGLANGQREQVAGYCDITGAKTGFIANTLVDASEEMILDMQYRLLRKMGCATTESPEFLEEWPKWERSMRFSHIPIHQRVFKIPVELFTEFERQKIYDRVKICQEWLHNFHEFYQTLNQ